MTRSSSKTGLRNKSTYNVVEHTAEKKPRNVAEKTLKKTRPQYFEGHGHVKTSEASHRFDKEPKKTPSNKPKDNLTVGEAFGKH